MTFSVVSNAQIVDGIIGQKRARAQALLKPYRILDYKKDREVHSIRSGIQQTLLFENDSCKRFFWAVVPEKQMEFEKMLAHSGYFKNDDDSFKKDSLLLNVRALESGKAVLYVASIDPALQGQRDAAGRKVVAKKKKQTQQKQSTNNANVEDMPRLQQAILEAEQDTTPKPKRDPRDQWVGSSFGTTRILGWYK